MAQKPTTENDHSALRDSIILLISLVVIVGSSFYLIQTNFIDGTVTIDQDAKIVWHLIRSSGMIAYILMLVSMVWGIFMTSKVVKDWSPGPVSMNMHSTLSWMALLVGALHAYLLMHDDYFTYTLKDILIPFTGDYRPLAVGLGTLAFWILLIVTLSFTLKKMMGQHNWHRLHYLSYLGFAFITVHGLFAGTDGTRLSVQILFGVSVIGIVLLTGIRAGRSTVKPPARKPRTPRKARGATKKA